MEWEQYSTDHLEQLLVEDDRRVSQLRARQILVLEELDRRQVATGDGCKNLTEWTAAKLDVSSETAKALVQTMRRTGCRSDLREALASGEVSFDRVEALSRIGEDVGLLQHLDVAGVGSEVAKRVRISVEDETRSAEDQFLVIQPNLDESWWRLWGGLDGYSGAMVDKALTEKADQLPPLPDGSPGDAGWRKAQALVEVCVAEDPPPAQVTVFVDTKEAAQSNAQAGVVLEAGPRVGKQVLEAVLCDAVVEVTARAGDGTPMVYGRTQRTAPPGLKRALLARATAGVKPMGAPAGTGSRSTMSTGGPKAGPPTPTSWWCCAGSTTRWWSTSAATTSTATNPTGSGSGPPTTPPETHPSEPGVAPPKRTRPPQWISRPPTQALEHPQAENHPSAPKACPQRPSASNSSTSRS